MKDFDWEFCKKERQPAVYEYLRANYNKKLTEEQFVSAWSSMRRSTKRHASKKYAPSAAKKHYKNLKSKFGFF